MSYIYILLALSGILNIILLCCCYYLATEIQKDEYIIKGISQVLKDKEETHKKGEEG